MKKTFLARWSDLWRTRWSTIGVVKTRKKLIVNRSKTNGNWLIETKDAIPYHQETTSDQNLEMWMPRREKKKPDTRWMADDQFDICCTLFFEVVLLELDVDFLLWPVLTRPSVASVGMMEADVAVSSRGVGVFESLLLLLSFKLRRRTGFLRIRLWKKNEEISGRIVELMKITWNLLFVYWNESRMLVVVVVVKNHRYYLKLRLGKRNE